MIVITGFVTGYSTMMSNQRLSGAYENISSLLTRAKNIAVTESAVCRLRIFYDPTVAAPSILTGQNVGIYVFPNPSSAFASTSSGQAIDSNITWNPGTPGVSRWRASTQYQPGQCVLPTGDTRYCYMCAAANGTSGSLEPAWRNVSGGQTVSDNNSISWVAYTNYPVDVVALNSTSAAPTVWAAVLDATPSTTFSGFMPDGTLQAFDANGALQDMTFIVTSDPNFAPVLLAGGDPTQMTFQFKRYGARTRAVHVSQGGRITPWKP